MCDDNLVRKRYGTESVLSRGAPRTKRRQKKQHFKWARKKIVIILMTNSFFILFRVRREIFIKWQTLFKCLSAYGFSGGANGKGGEKTFFMVQQENFQIVTINAHFLSLEIRFFLISMCTGWLYPFHSPRLCVRGDSWSTAHVELLLRLAFQLSKNCYNER